jgi:AcrR family transcriptional regulator
MQPANVGSARDRIREAAVELMGRKGVGGTTTQEIARRAGCSQAAIYKYWESKDNLAQESFDAAHRLLIGEMEAGARPGKSAPERVEGALRQFLGFARRRPAEYSFLFQVFHSDYARWLSSHAIPRDIVVRELERGMRTGEIPPGNAQLKAALLLGMTIRLAFFERQRLLGTDPAGVDEGLARAVASVLAS